jgi:tetratricopeptide (TPR) repeat protein
MGLTRVSVDALLHWHRRVCAAAVATLVVFVSGSGVARAQRPPRSVPDVVVSIPIDFHGFAARTMVLAARVPTTLPDAGDLPAAARPALSVWLQADTAMREARRALLAADGERMQALRAQFNGLVSNERSAALALVRVLDPLPSPDAALRTLLGELRYREAAERLNVATDAHSECSDTGRSDCGADPVIDASAALAHWREVPATDIRWGGWAAYEAGFALRQMGRDDDGRSAFLAAATHASRQQDLVAQAALELGQLENEAGNVSAALRWLGEASAHGERALRIVALRLRATILIGAGRGVDAVEDLASVLRTGDAVDESIDALGSIVMQAGAAGPRSLPETLDAEHRARALENAAQRLSGAGHHTWARAALDAARGLERAPETRAALDATMRDVASRATTHETPASWLRRAGMWCAMMTTGTAGPPEGLLRMVVIRRRNGLGLRAIAHEGPNVLAVLRCLGSEVPPLEGAAPRPGIGTSLVFRRE